MIATLLGWLVPDEKLLVGLWAAEDLAMSDEAVRREIGADVYVSSLRDGIECCITEARRDIASIQATA